MLFQASYKMYLCIQHVRYTKLNIFLSNSIGSGSMDEPRSYDTVAYQIVALRHGGTEYFGNDCLIELSRRGPNKIWLQTFPTGLKINYF